MDLKQTGDASGQTSGNAAPSASAALDSAIDAAISGNASGKPESGKSSTAPPELGDGTDSVTDDAAPKADENDATAPRASSESTDDTEPDPATDGQSADADAPKHWPEERRKQFSALPKEGRDIVQRFVKDLQSGFTKKMQQVGDAVKWAEQVYSVFNDTHRAQMQQARTDEIGAIRHLVQLHDYAARDPVGYVEWFKAQNPQAFAQAAPAQQQGKTEQDSPSLDDLLVDPKVKSLEQQLAELSKWRSDQEAQRQNWQRQQQQQHAQSLHQTITAFRTAQDESGNLRFPHFDQVFRAMGGLMQSHPDLVSMPDGPEKMAAAYDMAVIADPRLRASVLDTEFSRREAEKARKAEAERAKRVTGVRAGGGASAVRPKPATLDDAIDQAMSGFQ